MTTSIRTQAALTKLAATELQKVMDDHLAAGNVRTLGNLALGALPGAAIGAGSALLSSDPEKKKLAVRRALIGGLLTGLPAGAYTLGMNRGEAGGYLAGAMGV